MLSLENLHFAYRNEKVLDGLSFDLDRGEFVLLIGSNGSGKSTLLRIASGLLLPEQGSVKFQDEVLPHPQVGHFGHQPFLYPHLSVEENLRFFAQLVDARKFVPEEWDLVPLLRRKTAELSRGQLARVSLCRLFLSSPSILLLDEPTSFLDEPQLKFLLQRLSKHRDDDRGAVLIATHDVTRLHFLATRAVLLDQGKVAADSPDIDSVISLFRERAR